MSRKTATASRRGFLKKIGTLGVMGTAAWLRSADTLGSAAPGRLAPLAIAGTVKTRADRDYESWRQAMMWHLSKPERKPDLIVQPRTEQDILDAVSYAAQQGLKIVSRSSGHNSTGSVLRDGGMLLDMSWFRDIHINAMAASARVQPAVWNLQVVEEAEKHGLAFPAAHCPSVAMGGYLLGGGMGWNHAHWGGVACHSLQSLEVITADAQKVTASRDRHPELFWAARGAGPGFPGIVTAFEVALYPAPALIMNSLYIHPLARLESVLEILEKLLVDKDERVEVLLLFMHNPQAAAGTPPEEARICFIGLNAFADSEDEARAMLGPAAQSPLASGSVFKMEFQHSSFHKLYHPDNVDTGLGRYAVDTDWVDDLAPALLAVAEHFRSAPSPRSHLVASLAIDTTLHNDACFSVNGGHFIGGYAVWDEEKDDAANYAWLEEHHRLMSPFSRGHYVNEITGDRHPQRYPACFSKANWKRLQAVRRKYDPQGVFHGFLGHD